MLSNRKRNEAAGLLRKIDSALTLTQSAVVTHEQYDLLLQHLHNQNLWHLYRDQMPRKNGVIKRLRNSANIE